MAEQVDELQREKPTTKGKKMQHMWTLPKKKEYVKRIKQRHGEKCWKISEANAKDRTINKDCCLTKECQDGFEKQPTKWKQVGTASGLSVFSVFFLFFFLFFSSRSLCFSWRHPTNKGEDKLKFSFF